MQSKVFPVSPTKGLFKTIIPTDLKLCLLKEWPFQQHQPNRTPLTQWALSAGDLSDEHVESFPVTNKWPFQDHLPSTDSELCLLVDLRLNVESLSIRGCHGKILGMLSSFPVYGHMTESASSYLIIGRYLTSCQASLYMVICINLTVRRYWTTGH